MSDRLLSVPLIIGLGLMSVALGSHSVHAEVLVTPVQNHPGTQGLVRAGAMRKADTALAKVFEEYRAHAVQGAGGTFKPGNSFIQFHRGRVLVEAQAFTDGDGLLADLQQLGLKDSQVFGNRVSGWLPIGKLKNAVELTSLQAITAARDPVHSTGSVNSQGDVALRADIARMPAVHDVDGSGVTVGVLSDSYNVSTLTTINATDDKASGDLPPGNPVVSNNGEYSLCGLLVTCIDEGRAMMQIVHDIAPGAKLKFHTGMGGTVAYANAILELAGAGGSDVIVDDLSYLNEPFFQDGVVAQAVDTVVAGGVMYFSAAGNSGRDSYESPFVDSGEDLCIDFSLDGICDETYELVGDMHDFEPGPGVDPYLSVTVPVGQALQIAFQWNDPFGNPNTGDGPENDHIIVLLDATGEAMLEISANDNVTTGEPWEALQFINDGAYGTQFNIVITHDWVDSTGTGATRMKWVDYSSPGVVYLEHQTNSPAVVGHVNAQGAISTGAAYWGDTPEFGVSPPVLETYSSAGGNMVLFDTNGDPQAPEVRNKPEITATDGVSTTFFFTDSDPPGGDGLPDFFGTSAAAPHAAGVAALMLEADPGATKQDIVVALGATAIDMESPGFDHDSGFGLIQADAAITALLGGGVNLSPAANFGWDDTMLSVQFNDTSSDIDGSIAAWDWDFGDGLGTSAAQNPLYAYAAPGLYPVVLTVTDDDGASDSISRDVLVTNFNPPAAPTGLLASATGPDSIDLSWSDNAGNETGFEVQRSPDGFSNWTNVANLGVDATAHTDSGLAADTTYWYRVRAVNGDGPSLWTNTASATTDEIPPDWEYLSLAAAEASGDLWLDGQLIRITGGADFHYLAALAVDGHSGLIHAFPAADGFEVGSVALYASEPTDTDPDAFAPAWDPSQSVGTQGVDYDFDTNAGRSRLDTLTASGQAFLNGPQAVTAGDTSTFFIIDAASATAGASNGGAFLLHAYNDGATDRQLMVRVARTGGSDLNWVVQTGSGSYLDTGIPYGSENRLWLYVVGNTVAVWDDAGAAPVVVSSDPRLPGTRSVGRILSHTGDAAHSVSFGYHLHGRLEIELPPPPAAEPPGPGAITLEASAYKLKGKHYIDLTWSGAGGAAVEIYRDGGLLETTANDGSYTDATNNKGAGAYTHQVCELGGSPCSNIANTSF